MFCDVLYIEDKDFALNPAYEMISPRSEMTFSEFVTQYSTESKLIEAVFASVRKSYVLESSTKEFGNLNKKELEDRITSGLQEVKIGELLRPDLVGSIGKRFGLKRVAKPKMGASLHDISSYDLLNYRRIKVVPVDSGFRIERFVNGGSIPHKRN